MHKTKINEYGYILKIDDIFIFSTLRLEREDAKAKLHDWPHTKHCKVVKVKITEQ